MDEIIKQNKWNLVISGIAYVIILQLKVQEKNQLTLKQITPVVTKLSLGLV